MSFLLQPYHILLDDDQRRMLAVKTHAIGRKALLIVKELSCRLIFLTLRDSNGMTEEPVIATSYVDLELQPDQNGTVGDASRPDLDRLVELWDSVADNVRTQILTLAEDAACERCE